MRKHNEGYTLPFVMVVFLILSLVVVTILTVAVNNLHGQKASIQRMEERYTAQGAIEAVVAKLPYALTNGSLDGESAAEVITALVDEVCKGVATEDNGYSVIHSDPNYTTGTGNEFAYYVTLTSESGSAWVIGRIKLSGEITVEDFTGTPDTEGEAGSGTDAQNEKKLVITISNPSIIYESYRITTIGETEVPTNG